MNHRERRRKETDFLSTLHSLPEGREIWFCQEWYHKIRYKRMLRQGLICEKDGSCFITEAGKQKLDGSRKVLPCALKEFFFERIPREVERPNEWRSHVQIELDEESNASNLKKLLPEEGLNFWQGIMDSSPEEIAVFASGRCRDGTHAENLRVVLLSPYYEDKSAPMSKWMAELICKEKKALLALLQVRP